MDTTFKSKCTKNYNYQNMNSQSDLQFYFQTM